MNNKTKQALEQPAQPQQEPQRWAAYSEGDELVTMRDTEGEACGEKECDIDNEFEPGTEVEYLVAPMLSAKQMLRTNNAYWIGERILEEINEGLADDMCAEDSPLSFDKEDAEELGRLVIDFLCARGKTQWWTVDNKREEKRTYVAGSNDEATHGTTT